MAWPNWYPGQEPVDPAVVTRNRIVERFLEWVMGNFAPEHCTVYPDMPGLPVRALMHRRPIVLTHLKPDNYTVVYHFEDEPDWPELQCAHEWTAVAYRESCMGKYRLWYCDHCAALGPRKVQTKKEVVDRVARAGLGGLVPLMTKSEDLISKV